jgi:hypothetical protein
MALVSQNFDIYAGDTKDIIITVKKKDGTPVNLSGATIKWVAVRGKTTIISKDNDNGIVITDAINGECTIRLDHLDTLSLLGSLYYECVVIDTFGNQTTVAVGTMKVLASFV